MSTATRILPLTPSSFDAYISAGTASYRQHYLHLWQDGDPGPYISRSFTREVLEQALEDPNLAHYVITSGGNPAGILKLVLHRAVANYSAKQALLLEKVYLLREFTGMGIGGEVLSFAESIARDMGKKVLWLDTMKRSRALPFYLRAGFEIRQETNLEFEGVREAEKGMYILIREVGY